MEPAGSRADVVDDRHFEAVGFEQRPVVCAVNRTSAIRVEEPVGCLLVVVRRLHRGHHREGGWAGLHGGSIDALLGIQERDSAVSPREAEAEDPGVRKLVTVLGAQGVEREEADCAKVIVTHTRILSGHGTCSQRST